MTFDADLFDLGVHEQCRGDLIQDAEGLGQDHSLVRLEEDFLGHDKRVSSNGNAPMIGASVFVFEAVHGLGLKRTLVAHVENAILVIVGIRTAIAILKSVFVFRLLRTLVIGIDNSIAV